MKKIAILGSTGSIGTQSLEVIKNLGYKVTTLAAHSNIDLLEKQAREYNPKIVCIYKTELYNDLCIKLKDTQIKVVTGIDGLCEAAAFDESDLVINSVVGMIGLRPTIAAIKAKKDIALANKETLVTGGKFVMDMAKEYGVKILPVDSEHSAIFQCIQGNQMNKVNKILLTASGGPFFGKTADDLKDVTVEQALKHPNWSMGAKITIDSATLMNKGLELIEAAWLFDKSPDDIEVVVHKQSIIHSAVEFDDYSVIAQLGVPDMKIPIQYALTYPNRYPCDVKRLSLFDYKTLTFEKADEETFKCLKACKRAIKSGGMYPVLANGANEQAVELFLNKKISFLQIGELVEKSLDCKVKTQNLTIDDIFESDIIAREFVKSQVD